MRPMIFFTNQKTARVSYDVCCNSIKPVLVNTPKQSIQRCTPLVNIQFAPGFSLNSIYFQISIYTWQHTSIQINGNGLENKLLKTYINSSPSR